MSDPGTDPSPDGAIRREPPETTDPPRRKRTAGAKKSSGRQKSDSSVRGRVRARDPFELIRWLALSQADPRKALAELVQNSLDAGASRVKITRLRVKGVSCLVVFDDGEGPIPELDRPEALRFIATNIGHSRKRSLSPQERLQLMTQGQYGIGLLGFWAIGERLEMRSALPGRKPHRLVLYRDRPDYLIEPLRGRLDLDERWTEIVVVGVHPEVSTALTGRRIAEYLASELRGQLLTRSVQLEVEDKIARGRSQKKFQVTPRRFLGHPIGDLRSVPVPGHPPITLELYYLGNDVSEEAAIPIAVCAAGTVAADSFHGLADLRLDRAPWTDRRLTGFVDFPAFSVAPGSRRGISIDSAAEAFARALATIEPRVRAVLEEAELQRTVEQDRSLIKSLQRAFRDFYKQRPRYEMLPVRDPHAPAANQGAPNGSFTEPEGAITNDAPEGQGDSEPPDTAAPENGRTTDDLPHLDPPETSAASFFLLPPGPLAAVRFVPKRIQIEAGEEKRIRAEAIDADGRLIPELMEFEWQINGDCGVFAADGRTGAYAISDTGFSEMILRAGEEAGRGVIRVEVRTDHENITGEVAVKVVEPGVGRGEGIPEPEFVDLPSAAWRSRMVEGQWQVNSGHPDFRRTSSKPTLRLRYLATLFAKEVVLRNHHDPRMEQALEQLIEVSAYADRNLSNSRERK